MKLRCIAASCEKFDFKKQTLFALLGVLNLSVFYILITENPFIFYILYEFLVIPIILIICFWGRSVERIHAIQSLLLYTVICASPLIVYLAGSKAIRGLEVLLNCFSARIIPFMLSEPGSGFKGILGITLGFRFLVKFPQFAIHM